jgi:hypothetical protein
MYATASCPIFPQAEQSGSPEARKEIKTVVSNFILMTFVHLELLGLRGCFSENNGIGLPSYTSHRPENSIAVLNFTDNEALGNSIYIWVDVHF